MCDLCSEFWWLQPPWTWRWRAGGRGCGGRYCVRARLRERVEEEEFWRLHGLCLRHQLSMRKSGPPSRSCLPLSSWAPHYGTRFLRVSLEFNSLLWKFLWIWWRCPSERARTPAQDPFAFAGHSLNPITALFFFLNFSMLKILRILITTWWEKWKEKLRILLFNCSSQILTIAFWRLWSKNANESQYAASPMWKSSGRRFLSCNNNSIVLILC